MNNIDQIKKELLEFKSADKFKKYQDLQPAVENSTEEAKRFVNNEMDRCCDEILAYLNTSSPNDDELKQIGRNSLERVEDAMLDTEDREFCYELFHIIGNITGVDLEDDSIDLGDKLMNDMERILKKAGLKMDDFLPPKKD